MKLWVQVSRNARRGVDPVTSSSGRDLPPFEDEDEVIGGGGQDADEDEEEVGKLTPVHLAEK